MGTLQFANSSTSWTSTVQEPTKIEELLTNNLFVLGFAQKYLSLFHEKHDHLLFNKRNNMVEIKTFFGYC